MTLLLLITILAQSSLVDYKFWNDICQIFQDYSGNNQHSINGGSISTNSLDTICTDRGSYFTSQAYISLPPNSLVESSINLFPESFTSLYIYPIISGTILSRSLSKYGFSQFFTISLSCSYSELSETKGLSIDISLPVLNSWSLVTLQIGKNFTKIYIQEVLEYTFSFSIDIGALLVLSDFYTLGNGFEGFIYEFWIDKSFTNYILKADSILCVPGQCFYGFDTTCICSYCITSPSILCVADVPSPYFSSNMKTCSAPLTPTDIAGECRICPSGCSIDWCSSDYICLDSCLSPCSQCVDVVSCQECENSLMVASNGLCQCQKGSFMNSGACVPCKELCGACEAYEMCTNCTDSEANLVSTEVGFKCECGFGTYWDGHSCSECAEECLGCKSNWDDCIRCRDNNSEKGESGCRCKDGFFQSGVCKPCGEFCEECLNSSNCIRCQAGLVISEGNCIEEIANKTVEEVCALGYVLQEGNCEKCISPCLICVFSGYNCVNCIDNAVITQNLSCKCDEGFFFINETCILGLFLEIQTGANVIYLEFSEELETPLNESMIDLQSDSAFIWTLNDTNNTIAISCQDYNEKISIKIIFLNLIQGVNGGILIQDTYNELVECQITQTRQDNNTAIAISYIFTTFTLVISLLGLNNVGPSLVWTLIGTMQLLSYMSNMQVNFPFLIHQYLLALNFLIVPDFFGYFFQSLNPNSFLGTTGRDMFIILVSITTFWILIFVERFSKNKARKVIRIVLSMMKWSVFLRIWIICYVEVLCGAITQIFMLDCSNSEKCLSSVLGIGFLILVYLTPIWVYVVIILNYHRITDKKFLRRYSSIVEDFNPDNIQSVLYYYYYFIRRLAYILNLLLLQNFQLIQSVINIALSLAFLFYLIKNQCFKGARDNYFCIICEISLLISIIICTAFIFQMSDTTSLILSYCCIGLGGAITLLNLALSLYGFVEKINSYKKDKLQHGPTFAAHKNLPSMAALHISSASVRNSIEESENND